QAEPLPVLEDLVVAQQHVAARLQVVLLAHAALLQLAADREAVLGVDEGHVVHDEDVGLGDAREVLGGGLRRGSAVRAAVEGPRAAERAVPGAAARQLGGGARIEDADEVLVAAARDRKSTRLNSSHVSISYAVFCLKKKKNNTQKYCSNTRNTTNPPPAHARSNPTARSHPPNQPTSQSY